MRIVNRKANFNYRLEPERFEAGLSLLGSEAKSIREHRASINEAVVRIMDSEAYLINANIPALGLTNYNPTRIRKLLLHKSELVKLETRAKQQKLTLVPLVLYTKGRLVKLGMALGKSKRKFEKKDLLKKKAIEREIVQTLKE